MKEIKNIKELLDKKECVFWKNSSELWVTENSTVESSPVIKLEEIYEAIQEIRVAISLVDVKPKKGEPLHYHDSHVIGVITEGNAVFRYKKNNEEKQIAVEQGDVVLIPENAYHVFECDDTQKMKYMALEFASKEIDYQKHRLF